MHVATCMSFVVTLGGDGKWVAFVSRIVDLLSQYVVVTCHNANLAKSK